MSRRRTPRDPNRLDRHHMQYYAAQHESMAATKAIREMPGQIVLGPRYIHDQIHSEVEYVPALSMHMAQHVLQHYHDVPEDNLKSMDNYLLSVEKAMRHPKCDEIELAIAEVAMHAIELQRPFISEMQRSRRRVIHSTSTGLILPDFTKAG